MSYKFLLMVRGLGEWISSKKTHLQVGLFVRFLQQYANEILAENHKSYIELKMGYVILCLKCIFLGLNEKTFLANTTSDEKKKEICIFWRVTYTGFGSKIGINSNFM